jgi:hypothetical protein
MGSKLVVIIEDLWAATWIAVSPGLVRHVDRKGELEGRKVLSIPESVFAFLSFEIPGATNERRVSST